MGAGIINRDVIFSGARRWLLFTALLLVGIGYVAFYAFFVTHSENFIVVQRNRRTMQFGMAHPTSLPAVWTFGKGGVDDAHLGSGWAALPHGGVQIVTPDAWMLFTTTAPSGDVSLTLSTTFFTTPDEPLNRVEVFVNGQSLGSWQRGASTARTPIEVKVPRALVGSGQWSVRVHVDHLASLFRPDVGVERNGQHVVLNAVALRAASDDATADSQGSGTPAH
jgi:hypothetical protein